MANIKIITDSGADLPANNSLGVQVLPMHIHFGDQDYLDGVTLSHQEFYEKLEAGGELPVTSLIPPGEFETAFRAAVEQGQQVLAITVSSGLSGTYQSACLAAAEFPGTVRVVDSLNAAVGEQALVRYALELVQKGMELEALAQQLETAKTKLHTLALLDTLEYLKKGGRISKTAALVGGMLSVKPVAAIENGVAVLLGTARGSRNGNNFLVKEIEKTGGVDFSRPVCLGYTGQSDALLQRYVTDSRHLWEGHGDRLEISCVGSTVGTHIGPNAVAVSFFAL